MSYGQPLGHLARLLMVVPWLIREREVRIREMERRFAVRLEQLINDMEALNEVDLFVSPEQRFSVEITEEHVRVVEAPNFPATPGFLPFEGMACLIAAKTLLGITADVPDLRSAAEKLERALMPQDAGALRILAVTGPTMVKRLQEWTIAREVVRLLYRSTDKGELSDRVVEPWQVYQWRGVWYLWGYCRTKEQPRRYRLDGIRRAESTREGFNLPRRIPPPPTDYRPGPDDHRVVFAIRPAGRWITEQYSMRVMSEDAAGLVLAEFYTRDPRIAARLALRLGPDLRIVEGDDARQALEELAAAVLERYQESTGIDPPAPANG